MELRIRRKSINSGGLKRHKKLVAESKWLKGTRRIESLTIDVRRTIKLENFR